MGRRKARPSVGPAQLPEHLGVITQGNQEGRLYVIRQAKPFGGFPDDAGKLRVMYVANVREQVVFDLIVQATNKPRHDAALRRKVGSSEQLVDCPAILQVAGIIRDRVSRVIHNVRRLEYTGGHEAQDEVHHGKEQKGHIPGNIQHDHRDDEEVSVVQQFGHDKFHQRPAEAYTLCRKQAHFGVADELADILCGDPHKGHHAVEYPGVDVLKAMEPIALLMRREAQDLARVDILIHAADIGKGVVQYIVLYPPVERIAANEIKQVPQCRIYEFVPGIRTVVSIVHNREAYAGRSDGHKAPQQDQQPGVRYAPADQYAVKRGKRSDKGHRFDHHFPIGITADVMLLEIKVHLLAKLSHKVPLVVPVKFYILNSHTHWLT